MFMGFIIHFYIIFGTNLLTGGPVPVLVFPCFRVSQKRNTKRSPIDVPIFNDFYGQKEAPGVKELGQKSPGLSTSVAPPPTDFFRL